MSPLKKVFIPITAAVLAAALLVPSVAGAQRPGRDCDRNPNDRLCQQFKQRQEFQDRQKGITPACRAAANRYSAAKQDSARANYAIKQWKAALKKAKSDKAKRKASKELKKSRKRFKTATKKAGPLKTSMDAACAGARVKPLV